MADDADLAAAHNDVLMAALVKVRKPAGPAPTGHCLWCEEPLNDTVQRWCDADCRNDYELAEQNAPHLIP